MDAKRAKLVGITVVFFAFLVSYWNSLAVTNPGILDTDPGTYVIAAMLMTFAFIAFAHKEDIAPETKAINIAVSIAVFAAYAALLSIARLPLSSSFMSFRIDALMLPIVLVSLIMLVFGAKGLRRMLPVVVYSVFASPLVLLPLLKANAQFANINAQAVYLLIRGLGAQVVRSGLSITALSGSSISISSACVSIGTFVAFAMFLIPVAYFYEGKASDKIYWLVSAVALVVALNFARMLLIASVWVYYGLGAAISTFHAFAGELIFYASIIIMLLIAGKFGMTLGAKKSKARAAPRSKFDSRKILIVAAVAFLVGFSAFALNYGYANYVRAPSMLFVTNASNSSIQRYELNSLEYSGSSIAVVGSSKLGNLFILENGSRSVYVVVNETGFPVPVSGYSGGRGSYSYLLRNGIRVSSAISDSNGSALLVNYFSKPYNTGNGWIMLNYFMFENYSGYASCGYPNGMNSRISEALYNLVRSNGKSATMMCESYLIANSR